MKRVADRFSFEVTAYRRGPKLLIILLNDFDLQLDYAT
jgi:hypothetical protein